MPTKAGDYFLEFSHTHEYELGSGKTSTKTRVRSLEVRHGLPAKLYFATRMRDTVAEGEELGEAGRPVEVTLRDAHKNVCTRISGMTVALFVRGDQVGSTADVPAIVPVVPAVPVIPVVPLEGGTVVPAVESGTVEAVVTDGRAVFAPVKMGSGGMGMYSFACGLAESELAREETKEWMKRLKIATSHFVYHNPEEEGHVLGDQARLTGTLRVSFSSSASTLVFVKRQRLCWIWSKPVPRRISRALSSRVGFPSGYDLTDALAVTTAPSNINVRRPQMFDHIDTRGYTRILNVALCFHQTFHCERTLHFSNFIAFKSLRVSESAICWRYLRRLSKSCSGNGQRVNGLHS